MVGWKICTLCGERKHYDFSELPDTFASDYSPLKSTNADGSVTIRPASRCKSCQAAIKAKRYAQLTDEERREQWKKGESQRDKEATREYARLYDERKRRDAGIPPRNFKDGRNRETPIYVNSAPISEFLRTMTRPYIEKTTNKRGSKSNTTMMGTHQLPSLYEIAQVIGMDDKHLASIRSRVRNTVDLRTVDKILTYFDAQHLLVIWYPETR